MLKITVREAGISSRHVERLGEAQEPHHVELAMIVTQRLGLCSRKEVSKLKEFNVRNIRE